MIERIEEASKKDEAQVEVEAVVEEVKEEIKEEVKVEEAKEEAVDYSKMTVAELKEVAASKDINVAGMKKAEIIEALTK